MSLRFIYGRSGSGKTDYCLKDINESLKKNESHPLILLVPEQFTFQSEKSLIQTIGRDENIRAEVLSFKRMAQRVFSEVGGLTYQHMKPAGRAMLIYRIMESVKDNLKVFSKAAKQQGFINTISETITELKRYGVTPEILKSASGSIDNYLLKSKLDDISLIFSEFEGSLHERYIDSQDDLTLLFQKLDASNQFNGAEIWIDGFSGFTPQEYKVIEKLLKKSGRVTISLCTDCLNGDGGYDNTDVFAPIKKTEERLLKIAMDNNIPYERPVSLNDDGLSRFKESPELKHLEKHIFSFPYKSYSEKTEDIEILKAANTYSEIEEVARDILGFCRDKGERFGDIVVASRDSKRYEGLIRAIFKEYNIPCFIDEKRDIKSNPLIVLIISALEIYTKRWSYESVFRYLKTGLLDIDREDINIIENYVLAAGIRGNKWKEDTWNYRLRYRYDGDMDDYEKHVLSRVNEIKGKIVSPLMELHSRLSGRNKVRDICRGLFEFLISIGAHDKIEALINEFKESRELETANEYSQVWNIIVEIMDQMVETMGDEIISIDQFVKILNVGFGEYKISLVPPALDQVLVTSVDRMKSHNARVLYIIGVNDGVFPSATNDEGILTDKDREALKSIGVELASDTRSKAFEEQFLIYTALTSSRKYLKLTYPIADHEGKTMRPSIIISKVKKIFPNVIEKSNLIKSDMHMDDLNLISSPRSTFNEMTAAVKKSRDASLISPMFKDVYRWYVKNDLWRDKCKKTLGGINYTNQVKPLDKNTAKKLYGSRMQFSVSRLEKYVECPFAYFVQYGLNAGERKVFEFASPDIGTFMHNILDEFSNTLEKENLTWRDIEREWCEEAVSIIVDNIISKIPGFILNSSPRYRYLSSRLKRILSSAVWIIAEHIKRSDFNPIGYEIGFGKSSKYPAITINLPSGEEINLIGRIDRADIMKKDGESYIRIVDYKSGDKDLSLSDIYHGLQIQLLTYLDAVLESAQEHEGSLHPAGILYFKIDYPIIKGKGEIPDEEIEREIMKKLKMKGLILNDTEVIKSMDRSMDGDSLVIPANLKKDGNIGSRTKAATKEQFKILRNHVKGKIVSLCSEMLNGEIRINPYKKKDMCPCKYCRYSSICQFDTNMEDNNYKVIRDKKDEEIWDMIISGVQQEVNDNEQ